MEDNYRFGHPFRMNNGGPAIPFDLRNPQIEQVFASKTEIRKRGISKFIADNPGTPGFIAAMEYDMKSAPRTTNLAQLREIGLTLPNPADIDTLSEVAVEHALWKIIYGMAILGSFFTGTNHLTNREMLRALMTSILIDDISDIPPTPDMTEFINLESVSPGEAVTNRDDYLPRPERGNRTIDIPFNEVV